MILINAHRLKEWEVYPLSSKRYKEVAEMMLPSYAYHNRINVKAVVGFNIVIDNIIQLNNELIEKMENRTNKYKVLKEKEEGKVKDLEGLIRKILKAIYEEEDVEIGVEDHNILEELKGLLNKKGKKRIGGQGAIVASIFKNISLKPLFISPFKNKRLTSLLKGVSILEENKNGRIKENIILEYDKGMKVLGKRTSKHNRVIISDRSSIHLPIMNKRTIDKIKKRDVAYLSSYHYFSPKTRDMMDEAEESLKHIKSKMPVHVELSHNPYKAIRKRILSILYYCSLGLNEFEYEMYFGTDIEKSIKKDFWEGIEDIINNMERYALKRLHLHTHFMNMVVVRESDISVKEISKREINALIFGNLYIKAKAELNEFPTLRDMARIRGISIEKSKKNKGEEEMLWGMHKVGDYYIFLAPLFNINIKLGSVGLGDAITSTTLLREIELKKSRDEIMEKRGK